MTSLRPTITGWRSDDGYSFALGHGPQSKRLISRLVAPDGVEYRRAGQKHTTAADMLGWAEQDIREHRATGRVA